MSRLPLAPKNGTPFYCEVVLPFAVRSQQLIYFTRIGLPPKKKRNMFWISGVRTCASLCVWEMGINFSAFFFICVANASYTNKYTDSGNFFPFRRAHLSFLLSFRAAVTILAVCDALTHITLNTYWRIFSRPSAHRTNLLTLTENKERERRRRSVSMCIVTSVPHMSNVNNCWT